VNVRETKRQAATTGAMSWAPAAGGARVLAVDCFPGAHTTNNQETNRMKKIMLMTLAFTSAALLSAAAGDAKANYEKACVKCHGADGKGQTKMGEKLGIKDLTDAKVQEGFTDEVGFKAIKDGIKDKDGKTKMKAAEGLSDEDIKALVTYVRTLKK